jgi:hypothetical protein
MVSKCDRSWRTSDRRVGARDCLYGFRRRIPSCEGQYLDECARKLQLAPIALARLWETLEHGERPPVCFFRFLERAPLEGSSPPCAKIFRPTRSLSPLSTRLAGFSATRSKFIYLSILLLLKPISNRYAAGVGLAVYPP